MQRAGLIGGPLLAVLVFFLVPGTVSDGAGGGLVLGFAGRMTAALVLLMAAWWMTEAIPIYVTALLPVAVLPVTGVQPIGEITSVYAHPLIFLALGGFVLALALERWSLHKHFAFAVLRAIGSGPRRLVGGFMLVSAALSMWISNTATAVIMLPIAMSVIAAADVTAPYHRRFRLCLLLGIAYACSIGGVATLIGTGTNLFLASFASAELGQELSFARWMQLAVPVVLVFLPLAWLLLTRVVFRLPDQASLASIKDLVDPEPWRPGARRTLVVFLIAVLGWVSAPLRDGLPLLGELSDPGVAILCSVLLFLLPSGEVKGETLMDWRTANRLPWGVLLLLGGGLALAQAIDNNGVGTALAMLAAQLGDVPPFLVVVLAVVLMVFLTELTSNLASTATLVPVFAAMAPGLGIDPLQIVVPTAFAASCAFMLPVATPPNAIVFGSGMLQIQDMSRAGLWLNGLAIALIAALVYPLTGLILI